MVQVFARFIMRVRRGISWLIKQEGSPGERARGLAVGVFSGCFPFFGFQTFLGIILAYFLKGNHLLAVAGTWISNPVTYVPLYWFNYRVGCILIGEGDGWPDLISFRWADLSSQGWVFLSRIFWGSTLVGISMGSIVGIVTFTILKQYSRHINHL